MQPTFSLIVPTRGRPAQLRRFLASIEHTARRPHQIEVILVVDEDDPTADSAPDCRLHIRRVIGPAGRTMGQLNTDGYTRSTGRLIMLLNDDVVIRTAGWDATLAQCFARFPDPIALVHVNDTLMRDHLCTFPLVSRAYCEAAGGICPTGYRRYRIDDHIEDVFNLIGVLGHRRSVYVPDVIFEHMNAVVLPLGGRVYLSDPEILAQDAPMFDQLASERKELAIELVRRIEGHDNARLRAARRALLDSLTDPFSLRTPARHDIQRASLLRRGYSRYQSSGIRGLTRAVAARARRLLGRSADAALPLAPQPASATAGTVAVG